MEPQCARDELGPFLPYRLIPYSQDEVTRLENFFELCHFDRNKPTATILLEGNAILYLNPIYSEIMDWVSSETRYQAVLPFGTLLGIKRLGEHHPIDLHPVIGQPFVWRPCGEGSVEYPMVRCVNASSMFESYTPSFQSATP